MLKKDCVGTSLPNDHATQKNKMNDKISKESVYYNNAGALEGALLWTVGNVEGKDENTKTFVGFKLCLNSLNSLRVRIG